MTEQRFRSYICSVITGLRKGRNLPILNFQFLLLVNAVTSETGLDKELVKEQLTNLFSMKPCKDVDTKTADLIDKYEVDKLLDPYLDMIIFRE